MAGTANGLSQQGKGDTSKASRTSIRRIFRSRASPRRLPCRTCRVSYGSLSPRPSSRQVGLLGSNDARNHKQTSKTKFPTDRPHDASLVGCGYPSVGTLPPLNRRDEVSLWRSRGHFFDVRASQRFFPKVKTLSYQPQADRATSFHAVVGGTVHSMLLRSQAIF